MEPARRPASLAEIIDALSALGLEPDGDLRFSESAKPRYKRLAQRRHPDRQSGSPPLEAAAHERAFKLAKEAYELIECEHLEGRWPPAAFDRLAQRLHSTSPAIVPGPKQMLADAWAAFVPACEAMASHSRRGDLGAGSRALAACCHLMAASRPWPAESMPWIRLAFLRALWSVQEPHMARMASHARPMIIAAGLAPFAEALDPFVFSWKPAGCPDFEAFDLPSSIALGAERAGSSPDASALLHWRALPSAHPRLRDPASLSCAMHGPAEPLMARLLRLAPRAAEALAPACSIRSLATPDWLALCCASRIEPAPFIPWFSPLSLDSILDAARLAGPEAFERWQLALSQRISFERRADLADFPGGPPELADLARALSTLARIEHSCSKAHLPQEPFEAAYDPSASAARRAFERALAGDADGMASLLVHADLRGLDATRLLGTPIACAVAAKAYFRPDIRSALLSCLAQLPSPMRAGALSARDANGRSAASWIAKMATPSTSTPPGS